ncbi:peptide-methionine (S)-S-oxide reductase MsrA [Parapedobacter koreensis]|uniref:Peptide methionine sulfoxide reductase MsrA n=1 Tax=Parapedobacter koreensis TaxID=332977 RepID=A0A1H7SAW1_9SPHI|nr:peptide-methionine (S)-S-oxide reductase MsrA [Parapedobacter koreensis]SEL68667.1 peptide-methionine (S)-S-oxide reductase [Parapedobacter koreensis]
MIATFGGGCFWCTEVIFKQLEGVNSVLPGYMGGQRENPTYEQVCTGATGHAEVVQIDYDATVLPYRRLLEVFFKTHDPTTLNRQGNDVGTQYRSVIFYHDEQQRIEAEEFIRQLATHEVYDDPIVTELSPAQPFYVAENYHHDYFNNNPQNAYCSAVIAPKLHKFLKSLQ